VVMTSLPLPRDVEDVVYGKHGLLAGWKKGDILVEMSTNSPAVIRKIAKDALARGVEVLSIVQLGSPHWKHSELFFEKKPLIPDLQQLLTTGL